jgi:putative peptidoglycan lipid II flippase
MLSALRDDRKALNELFNSIFTACLLIGLLLGGFAAITAPFLMRLVGPGLAPETHTLATLLFRLMLPMLVLQALLSVCKGGLNTLDSYGPPEFAGAVFNVVMIAAAVCLTPYVGIVSLALGASGGALVQLLMQFPYLTRYGVVYYPRLRFGAHLRRMVSLARGALLSTMLAPLGALIDRALASFLFPGAVAALNYAFLLFLLPASLCVVPLSTVSLTDLANLYHQGNFSELRRRALASLRLVLLLTVPITLGGVLLVEPLTRLVYEYGRFDAADTVRTAQAARAYLFGLPFYGVVHLLSRSFYAMQDTMTPALLGLGSLGLNIGCDVLFMHWFSHSGIALARSVATLVNALALYVWFQRCCSRCSISQDTASS